MINIIKYNKNKIIYNIIINKNIIRYWKRKIEDNCAGMVTL
jgi:hypothetical protein